MRMEEHTKRWKEYRNSQSSMDDTSHGPSLPKHKIWIQEKLNSRGCLYDFGAEGVLMKWQSRLSVSIQFSSINNYDAYELATSLNESVCKAAEEAQEEELRKNIREVVATKLTRQFNNQWAEKEAALKKKLAKEKAARERERTKNKS